MLGRSVTDGKLPWKRKPGILWEALEQCGIPMDSVRLGGPPVENVAIDEEGSRTIARLGAISAVLGVGLGLVVAAQHSAHGDRVCLRCAQRRGRA